MNTNSKNPRTSASNLHPSPEREESTEELIKISQGPQEALLARVSDLEVRLAQVVHEHSALQAEQVQEQPIGLYIQGSNKLLNVMKMFRRMYEKQLPLKAKTQAKLFFTHVRRNRHLKKKIIGLKDNEGETIFAPSAQAELLKNFYSSNFREDDARPTLTLPFSTVVLPVPQFSIPVVHRALSSLNISKGAGHDDIHPQMVRWLADFLAESLSKLFANSLTTAVVPTDWRLAITCPIHKTGGPEDVSNYHPVSFNSIICKIFERNLKMALLTFLSDTRSISTHQHGFLPRRSCLSNLLVFEEAVTRMMDEGHAVDVALIFPRPLTPTHRLSPAAFKFGRRVHFALLRKVLKPPIARLPAI